MIGAHPTQYAKNNAPKDTYSANMKTLTLKDVRLNQAVFTKEKITTTCFALDIAHQSALEVKLWYLLDLTLMAVNYHPYAK